MKNCGAKRLALLVALAAIPVRLVPASAQAAPPVVAGSLVQAIRTSRFSPASPDPSGVVYLPGTGRFSVADSEVEETTGAGWHGANLWQIGPTGEVVNTGNTTAYTKEPTGLGFDPATGRLFVSSDNGQKVFILLPGADQVYGTSDDGRSVFLATGVGSGDAEDVAFDTRNGHLYIADGANTEVIDVDPGAGGAFGDGNDTSTHFDVSVFGAKDAEGIGYDGVRDSLVVVDRSTRKLYEVTTGGDLVRTIDIRVVTGVRNPSDVEIAPASTGVGRTYWVTDREVDNGPDPNENDGMLFEIAVPAEPSGTVVEVGVSASSDDAEQKANTNVVLDSDDLDMMLDGTATISHTGLRFTGVTVPAGATITAAYVQFTSDEIQTAPTTLTIAGQAAGDPPTFVAVKRDLSGRTLTSASVTWSDIPGWTAKGLAGPAQRTPDIAPVIQEIVDRGDWTSGNAVVLIVTGSGQRVARAYDHISHTQPLLHVEYATP